MKHICLTAGVEDAVAKTTETMIYPDIDASYDVGTYYGARLVVRTKQTFGSKAFASMAASLQGMAIYGNMIVRMANGSTHYIYNITDGGSISQLASFSANTGHSNSLQFAPTLESGQTYPYLYVANLNKTCSVLSISASYSVSIVQTITISDSSIDSSCNVQIGDDGHIWCASIDAGNHYKFVKFRKVLVSEGDVTLTSSDIVDSWATTELYPYASYVWQGMLVKNGQIWFSYGASGTGKERGFVVYDTATHSFVTKINLARYDVEVEDLDFWNDSILVATYSAQVYQLKF